MRASPASASAEPRAGPRVLVVGVNWLGDSVMAMPALQRWRGRHPAAELVLLVKPALRPLWALHAAPDAVWVCPPGPGGLWRAVRDARAAGFDAAYILPHSFRSALVPFLARVPRRIGPPGHGRDWMLTERRALPRDPARRHQAFESLAVLGEDGPLEPPRLRLAPGLQARAEALLGGPGPCRVALLPGAARGPAKRWPADRFAEVGRQLIARLKCHMVVLGSEPERPLADSVARAIGPEARSLAGRTSLPELAAVLARCVLAVANDSGGMHLAAAAGTPVAAVFGLTDPSRTGPLGAAVRVLQAGGPGRREVPRDSEEARARLLRVTPDDVVAASLELLGPARGSGAAYVTGALPS